MSGVHVPPETDAESAPAEIWEDVLGRAAI
jgi:hypothetical protein